MEEKRKLIFDIETDDVNATVIRCLSWMDTKIKEVHTITDYEEMKKFFSQNVYLIGHYITLFDVPIAERLLNTEVKANLIDTCALSWILFPKRNSHSLESFTTEAGIVKPKIIDYANQKIEEIIFRCESDIRINMYVWEKQAKYLWELYEGNTEEILRYCEYISFKMNCIAEHQKLGVKLDIKLCEESLKELEGIKEEKISMLKEILPKKPIKSIKTFPKKYYNSDGSVSLIGKKWQEFLKSQNLPENTIGEVEYIHSYEENNPNSHDQIKSFLFSLGWEPQTFDYKKIEGSKEIRRVPQIKDKNEDDGSLCPSVLKLIEKEPRLSNLDSLYVVSHRINVLKGFLRDQKNGRLYQGNRNFTNTLRLCHSGIVNLANPFKPYAENVRKCLVADEGKLLVGCDLKSIEDNTKRHYIYSLDPEYVKEQMTEGFDAHLDISVLAGLLTFEESEEHKLYEKTKGLEGKSHKEQRYEGKQVNFSAIYGVGALTLSRNSGIPEKQCKKLLETFWKRNWAIKAFAETLKVKTIEGQKWILNPISKFWYTLRAEKDRFSTVNQSSSVYVFDRWLFYIRQQGLKANFSMHDEWTGNILPNEKEITTTKIKLAIKQVNEELQLNVPIDCSIDYGERYNLVH